MLWVIMDPQAGAKVGRATLAYGLNKLLEGPMKSKQQASTLFQPLF